MGRESSVGRGPRYGLDGPGINSRLGGGIFSAPVQTGPGAHPTSYTIGTGSFLVGKAAEAWRWPPNPIHRQGQKKSRVIHLLPLWAFVACSRVTFTFTLHSCTNLKQSIHEVDKDWYLTFWRRNYCLILAHSLHKMWIIQEPNKLELWNKRHFEEEKTESIYRV